jgi:hypothetical protein
MVSKIVSATNVTLVRKETLIQGAASSTSELDFEVCEYQLSRCRMATLLMLPLRLWVMKARRCLIWSPECLLWDAYLWMMVASRSLFWWESLKRMRNLPVMSLLWDCLIVWASILINQRCLQFILRPSILSKGIKLRLIIMPSLRLLHCLLLLWLRSILIVRSLIGVNPRPPGLQSSQSSLCLPHWYVVAVVAFHSFDNILAPDLFLQIEALGYFIE